MLHESSSRRLIPIKDAGIYGDNEMKYAALIVTYNRLEKLQLCWKATAALSFEHIVIVDNASSDGTEQWLAAGMTRVCGSSVQGTIWGLGI